MRNLLTIWRVHGLDRLLRDAWARGIVLAGPSAGAMLTEIALEPDLIAPAPRGVPDAIRELRAVRYGSRRF